MSLKIHAHKLLRIKPLEQPDMKAAIKDLLTNLRASQIQGVKNVTALRVKMQGNRETCIALFGEIHNNPALCPSEEETRDVVLDIVVSNLLNIQPCVLVLETFNHLESPKRERMIEVLKNMLKNRYPLESIDACLASGDKNCVYSNGSNALLFLRTLTSIVRLLAIDQGSDSTIAKLSERIFAMDPREDLGMIAPFREILGRDPTLQEIIDSVARVTKEAVGSRLPKIVPEAYSDAFCKHIWTPFFKLRDDLERNPTLDGYMQLFLQIPDVMAVAHVVGVLGHALVHNMDLPIVMIYAGDTHRRALTDMLKRLPVFSIDTIIDRTDTSGGSCIRRSTLRAEEVPRQAVEVM